MRQRSRSSAPFALIALLLCAAPSVVRAQMDARPDPPRVGAVVPTAAQPQARPGATAAADRERSFEISVGAAAFYVGLNGTYLTNMGTPRMLGGVGRVGYNFTQKLGVSIGSGFGNGNGVSLVSPFAALTYTPGLNKKMFLTAGTGVTTISGNGNRITADYGVHAGIGVRSMIGEEIALRVEGRMGLEHYTDLLTSHGNREGTSAFNFTATLGLSYFMGGGPWRAP